MSRYFYNPSVEYSDAMRRCERSPTLSKYVAIIMTDAWADDNDHLHWVQTAKVREIARWAKRIKDGMTDKKGGA